MQWRPGKDDEDTSRGTGAAYAIVEDPVRPCAFCRGKGEKPVGSQCPVCRGKGTVEIRPPAVRCALCKGRGEQRPRGNVTCSACRGKGYITVTPPLEKCASCRGTGRQPGSRLACIACHGAGVVSAKPRGAMREAVSVGGRTPRPASTSRIGEQPSTGNRKASAASAAAGRVPAGSTADHIPAVLASELEILRLYALAPFGKRVVLSKATRRTPAYVNLLQKSLIKKGLLRGAGSHRLRITDRGLQVVRRRGGIQPAEQRAGAPAPEPVEPEPADLPPATASAPVPSDALENGLRWTALRGA